MSNLTYIVMPGTRHIPSKTASTAEVQVEEFPDGETSIRLPYGSVQDIKDKDIVLVGSCHSALASENFLAAAYEIASLGPKSYTVFNTYFRHARSERVVDHKAALAKFQARQWSGLGRVYPGVRLVFAELHKDTITNYFEGPVHTENRCFLDDLLIEYLIHHKGYQELHQPVFATVDEGGIFQARRLASTREVGFASIVKHRVSGTETHIMKVEGDDVNGRDVLIIDDMISTGGSMVNAAKAYFERRALSVRVLATHGVFSGNAVDKMKDAGISCVYVTNSHPNAVAAAKENPDFVKMIQVPFSF